MCIRTVPFGYAVEKGKKVIVADEAAVIIEVYEHYCSGETFKQIADSLTARGVKYLENDSQWNKNNVARLIDDLRYLGNEEYYETSKPASIKEALDGILPDYQCEFPYTEVMICRDPDADILVWEKPRTLCEGFTRNKPIQTASGRIVVPAYEYEGREYTLRLSDDGGNSFFTATATGKPSLHVFDELCVYEKAPNVLRFLARTSKNGYLESTSLDNGNSWSGATQYEDAPSSRCYIGKLKNGMVAYARNVSDKKRTGMKICLSSDGGDTFAWQMTIDERELVSYPDVADDGQGNIYVIYDRERDNRNKLNRETGISEAAKEILLCKISFDDVKNGRLSAGSFVQRVISKAKLDTVGL